MSFLDEEADKLGKSPPLRGSIPEGELRSYLIIIGTTTGDHKFFLRDVRELRKTIMYRANMIIEFPPYQPPEAFLIKDRHGIDTYYDQGRLDRDIILTIGANKNPPFFATTPLA